MKLMFIIIFRVEAVKNGRSMRKIALWPGSAPVVFILGRLILRLLLDGASHLTPNPCLKPRVPQAALHFGDQPRRRSGFSSIQRPAMLP